MEDKKISDKEENLEEKYKKELTRIIKKSIAITIVIVAAIALVVCIGIISHNSRAKDRGVSLKPIIYIYPEKEQEVEIKLLDKELITCSYPKYIDGWIVDAKPNGDLIDLENGNQLYSLYYEAGCKENYKVEKEGFCVKKEDIAKFLEEKLEILGLNYKEKEEFIVYWLPQLEEYEYVYIRFASEAEINNNMGLKITPEPETLIRVMMTWKGLDKPINVEEQKIESVKRTGYTVVEWGGSKI